MTYLGIGYWWALLLAPAAVGVVGVVVERLLLRRLYGLDNLYGLLLTFGLTLIAEGLFHHALRELRATPTRCRRRSGAA